MKNEWTEKIEELEKMVDNLHSVIESDEKLVEDLTEKLKATEEEMLFWRRESRRSDAGLNMAEDKIKELEAENKRLAALNDMFPPEIARLEDRVSEEYEAERADDRARIKELEAENRRLRELVDGATVAVELFKDTAPAQKKWREEWLNKAREALKEASHEGGKL